MRNMNNSQKTITSTLKELGAELGIMEADFGGKAMIEGKDPVIVSKRDWSVFSKALPDKQGQK